MDNTNQNSYLFKAMDAYPYNIEETMEALNYALSYHPEDAQALFLMGKVYAHQFEDMQTAVQYFEAAMMQNMELTPLYPEYAYALMRLESYKEAERLLEYALKVIGVDKARMYLIKGQLLECLGEFKTAVKTLKQAKKMGKNNDFISLVNAEMKRIKDKLPKNKKQRKKTKKSNNKKKKGAKKTRSKKK